MVPGPLEGCSWFPCPLEGGDSLRYRSASNGAEPAEPSQIIELRFVAKARVARDTVRSVCAGIPVLWVRRCHRNRRRGMGRRGFRVSTRKAGQRVPSALPAMPLPALEWLGRSVEPARSRRRACWRPCRFGAASCDIRRFTAALQSVPPAPVGVAGSAATRRRDHRRAR